MMKMATAVGNWWLTDSFITTTICIMSPAEFFGETSNHRGDSAPQQLRISTLWLLAFPKTKITFEREEISDHRWDSGKYERAADGDWENCVMPQGVYSEEDWGVTVLCTMFLVSCIFFNKFLFFIFYGWILSDRPHIPYKIVVLNNSNFWFF